MRVVVVRVMFNQPYIRGLYLMISSSKAAWRHPGSGYESSSAFGSRVDGGRGVPVRRSAERLVRLCMGASSSPSGGESGIRFEAPVRNRRRGSASLFEKSAFRRDFRNIGGLRHNDFRSSYQPR